MSKASWTRITVMELAEGTYSKVEQLRLPDARRRPAKTKKRPDLRFPNRRGKKS